MASESKRLPRSCIAIPRRCGVGCIALRRKVFEGLGDRLKPGRPRRLTAADESKLIALVSQAPPGRLVTQEDGTMVARDEQGSAQWSLTALAQAAKEAGIPVPNAARSALSSFCAGRALATDAQLGHSS